MKIQLLFVDFRGSSHAILEWFCFLRDDIAPGGVRRILSRVDLHVISCFASFLFPFPVVLLVHALSSFILWALRTCQVGHFDSHIFWFLIEFFIENLVLTGGRYTQNLLLRSESTVPSRPIIINAESTEYTIEINWSLTGSAERVFIEIFPKEGNCIYGCVVGVKSEYFTLSALTAGQGQNFITFLLFT